MAVEGVVYYLHGDHLGSTVLTTDGEGRRVEEVRYRPYGTERYRWGILLPITLMGGKQDERQTC